MLREDLKAGDQDLEAGDQAGEVRRDPGEMLREISELQAGGFIVRFLRVGVQK